MATGAKTGGRTGNKTGNTTGAGGKTGGSATRRVTSKPLIIDVDAEAAGAPTPSSVAQATTPMSGLDDAAAAAAGLWTRAEKPVAEPADAGPAESGPEGPTQGAGSPEPAPSSAPTAVPNAQAASGPGAFFLFAAGLVGALLAMALLFLAQLVGLISLPDGRTQGELGQLAALEQRLSAVENEPASAPTTLTAQTAPADISGLEGELAQLQARVAALAVAASGNDLSDRLTGLLGRVAELEANVAALSLGAPGAPAGAEALPAPTVDLSAIETGLAGAQAGLLALQADVSDVTAQLATIAQDGPQATARLDTLDSQLATLSASVAGVEAGLSALRNDLSTMDQSVRQSISELADAPVVPTPDLLARLGIALGGLIAARDGGADVGAALGAARAASSFDPQLAAALASLESPGLPDRLDGAGLMAQYDAARDAMRALAPSVETGGGLLGALEERARAMVSIRAPEGSLGEAQTLSGQIDEFGALMAAGRFSDAQALFVALPDEVRTAGEALGAALQARVLLDGAIEQAQGQLMQALSEPAP